MNGNTILKTILNDDALDEGGLNMQIDKKS